MTTSKSKVERAATFFATPAKFRAWLEKNCDKRAELWVGLYKRESGKPSITWPESVDEALCFGWIDGLRQNIDTVSYRIRFTPRKSSSTWSAINIKRMKALLSDGRVQESGQRAFAARTAERSRTYTYENQDVELAPKYAALLRKNKVAAKYFDRQAPSYRKAARRWIMSAKQEKTREARLAALIEYSAQQLVIPPFRWSMQARKRGEAPKQSARPTRK